METSDAVDNFVLERIQDGRDEYCAVPELHRCHHCEFETDALVQCQRAIGKRGLKHDAAYCHTDNNPHGVGIIWVKTEDLHNYVALAVARRMEGVQDG